MNKEEIKHFKAMLRQGSLRHMNILLDDKFQKELLNIIKDYEKLQQENKELQEELQKADSITQSCIFNGKKESELNFRQSLNLVKELRKENKKLQNKIHILEDELEWYKQECDDLEMRIGLDE